MTGVRRVRTDAQTRTACRSVVPCLLCFALLNGFVQSAEAQSKATPRGAAADKRLPRSIKDTV
ncbi:MAG: hypothetical protein NT069_06220, partial [Planctomycetota bacterium]|nr:hypothetical protein [Planctomycetota bacterium]